MPATRSDRPTCSDAPWARIRKEMQEQRADFVNGATHRGLDQAQANAIFDCLERFAEYGFNKSHAAAYALVAYQTAYMKANYPVEFIAASMTLDMGNTDKLAEFREEAKRLGIEIVPPSINRSGLTFEVEGSKIYYALGALKGCRHASGRVHCHRARREAIRRSHRRCLPHQPARSEQACAGKSCLRRRFRCAGARPRPCLSRVDAMLAAGQRAHDAAANGQSELFGGRTARNTCHSVGRAMVAGRTPAKGIRCDRFFS